MPAQDTLQVEWVSIDELFGNPANPRYNEEAVPHVAASIKRFGWRQPIVAKLNGEVIAGNTRLKAAKSLGCTEVPVVRFEGSDIEATSYSIADNRTHEFADWDEGALAKILQELRTEDALEGVGFSDDDIDSLLSELEEELPNTDVDDPGPSTPSDNPISCTGDLWILGDHRLLCGDSTNEEDIARLMTGEQAALLSTDPPYCVNYTGDDRPVNNGKKTGKDWSHVYKEVEISDLGNFLGSVLDACLDHVAIDSALYVWHAHVQQPVIASVFEEHGILLHQVVVWVKPCATFGYSFYRWRHEPCAFGWRKGHKPAGKIAQLDSVWELDWEGKSRVVGNSHPTQKPLRIFEIPMEQHTKPGDIVLEPFSGSGSQLIAAEKLRRKCRAMEISPAFVDVAVERWQEATGKDAVLESTGQTFTEVQQERCNGAEGKEDGET